MYEGKKSISFVGAYRLIWFLETKPYSKFQSTREKRASTQGGEGIEGKIINKFEDFYFSEEKQEQK